MCDPEKIPADHIEQEMGPHVAPGRQFEMPGLSNGTKGQFNNTLNSRVVVGWLAKCHMNFPIF